MTTSFDYKIKPLKNSGIGRTSPFAHIGISLNNQKHNGEKLDTLLTWASQKFEQVQLDIYDDIHAYNLQLERNLDYAESLNLARKMGDQWIQENRSVLAKYPNISYYRFADLSRHLLLEKRIHELQDLYIKNSTFRDLINEDICSYITRLENRGQKISQEKRELILNASRKYILDELALMSLLNEHQDFVEIYAGQFLNILNSPRILQIKDLPEGIKNYHIIEVDFVRRTEDKTAQRVA